MIRIYGDYQSGNCYKLKLICHLLSIEYDWIAIDILKGETRTDEFLRLNPNGEIPVCLTADDEVLTQSNAILFYLAAGSALWPRDQRDQTRVLEWQFFEQYNHEPSIAVARFIKHYQKMPENRLAEYEAKLKAGYRVLDRMEAHLGERHYLVGDRFSIADISLYAYTHVAGEGGFDMSKYPSIAAWLDRITELPGYVSMSG